MEFFDQVARVRIALSKTRNILQNRGSDNILLEDDIAHDRALPGIEDKR